MHTEHGSAPARRASDARASTARGVHDRTASGRMRT